MNSRVAISGRGIALRCPPSVGASRCDAQVAAARRPHLLFSPRAAFSLVELLVVIAIIAIMASIVISAFSNASADSRLVLVRQQQAVVQEAINSWLAHASASPNSLSSAQTTYNAATTGLARLTLVRAYLDDATYNELADSSHTTNADQVRSGAMVKTSQYLQITNWPNGSYPKVNLITP